jgi:hypothetical protein
MTNITHLPATAGQSRPKYRSNHAFILFFHEGIFHLWLHFLRYSPFLLQFKPTYITTCFPVTTVKLDIMESQVTTTFSGFKQVRISGRYLRLD